nr:immunoglobulin light chain junction region [Macaca mulatta]MOX97944.1 immunoglobulin light chain junction region [Macaca mulatta]MOX98250.1 immunoglobulin light chain junction region [Macaca mulatta]MOX99796.1 immunoglobulin light chain junction region [Macaca mulatta]MOY01566.1 immunoglobulin light chain junction region [Macaca mulatta]
CQHSYNLPLTF